MLKSKSANTQTCLTPLIMQITHLGRLVVIAFICQSGFYFFGFFRVYCFFRSHYLHLVKGDGQLLVLFLNVGCPQQCLTAKWAVVNKQNRIVKTSSHSDSDVIIQNLITNKQQSSIDKSINFLQYISWEMESNTD